MNRKATAVWHGTGKDGTGNVSAQSGAIKNLPYSWKTRFGDESGMSGTNPEEMIAAAHASCFTMAVSFQLAGAGFTADELNTEANLTMEQADGAMTITKIHLTLTAKVPDVTDEKFQELATTAKENCPISRVLKADITLDATLKA
ncbi:MAG: OsmC family protein [Gemmatimonadaceae bacterium]